MPQPEFFVGLDLGQMSDPTALVVLRRTPLLDDSGAPQRNHRGRRLFIYEGVHIERFMLGTPYPRIVQDVKALLCRPELQPEPYLAIDATGVGRACVDMFINEELPAQVHPVTITGGLGEGRREPWNGNHGCRAFWTPKIELVSGVQAALSSGRLRIGKSVPLADILKKELFNFKVKVGASGNESFGAWREGTHDDIVLATALAVYLGDQIEGLPSHALGPATPISRDPRRGIYDQLGRGKRRSILPGAVSREPTDVEWSLGIGRKPGGRYPR